MEKTTLRRTSILRGQPHTSVFNRVIAKAIDVLVIVAAYFLVSVLWRPLGIASAVLFCALGDAMGAGQSVGKRIVGMRVIEDSTGIPCSFQDSFLRNAPFALGVFFAAIPVFWVFAILVILPLCLFEVYLLLTLESGVRLGDVLGNTLVIDALEQPAEGIEG